MSINLELNGGSTPGPGGGGFDMDNELPDPGDGETIEVTEDGYMHLMTAGAVDETRYLGAPDHAGQVLVLIFNSPEGTVLLDYSGEAFDSYGSESLHFFFNLQMAIFVALPMSGEVSRWQLWRHDGPIANDVALRAAFGTDIEDPGDAGTIAADSDGTLLLSAGIPGTRTLGPPAFAGQILHMWSGGAQEITVTVGNELDVHENDTIVFNAYGQRVFLVATSALQWVLWSNSGTTLTGGNPPLTHGDLGTIIADPGDGQIITASTHGTIVFNDSGDTTRELNAPSFLGQELMLTADNPGNSVAVTLMQGTLDGTNGIMTFTGQAQTVHLRAIWIAASPRWRLLHNDGATLSPSE